MSDLTNYASGLSAYNKDGLELFIHNDGNVYATANAIARMVDMSQGAVYNYLKNTCDYSESVITTKVFITNGCKSITLYPVKAVVACAKKYSPDLLEKFSEMGAMVYLYQLAGYKVRPVVEAPTNSSSELAQAEYMQKLVTEKIEQLKYLADKPGMVNKLADAHGGANAIEAAKVDFSGLCELAGVTIEDHGQKCKYSAMVSQSLMNDTMTKMEKRNVTRKSVSGKYQSRLVTYYPVSAVSHLRNAMGIS